MRLEQRALAQALGTILMHNMADDAGARALKKGTFLTEDTLAQLAEMGCEAVDVAVLEDDDVREDQAALALAQALQTENLLLSRPVAGRVNLRTEVNGLLQVDADRLLEFNLLPGIALATRANHTVVGRSHGTDNVATLKIIPFAIRRQILDRALGLASGRPGMVEVRPFSPGRRVAMLFVGEPAAQARLRDEYLPPTQARLERLQAALVAAENVVQEEGAISAAAARLAAGSDLLIIAGQTSVMDEDDTILRGLRQAGATNVLSGAPVEPGNLMALAYLPNTPVLCAPGSAKGLKRNVVDLILPRLLLGDCLDRRDIAALGLGGFLTAAERGGDGR